MPRPRKIIQESLVEETPHIASYAEPENIIEAKISVIESPIEENTVAGGAGAGVNEVLNTHASKTTILTIGLPDRFIEQGTREEVLEDAGLDTAHILATISEYTAKITG